MTIRPEDMPEFQDIRSPEGRLYCHTHIRVEHGQPPAVVHPAMSIMFGATRLGENDTMHPQITVYSLFGQIGLTFIPNADELEALGRTMLDHAERMRADASDQASAAIDRARQSGGSAS